jgi:predicted DNA binding CopG/RHH family protein
MSKKFPDLRSDEEADAWLQGADLTEYDLSGMKKVRFELARKDASISLRLPAALLATLKANAVRANMPTQRLIRMMIEAQLGQAETRSPSASLSEKPARLCRQETARLDTGANSVLPKSVSPTHGAYTGAACAHFAVVPGVSSRNNVGTRKVRATACPM